MYGMHKDLMHVEDHSNDDIGISDYLIIHTFFYKNIDKYIEYFNNKVEKIF
jgi:hypothetical protein